MESIMSQIKGIKEEINEYRKQDNWRINKKMGIILERIQNQETKNLITKGLSMDMADERMETYIKNFTEKEVSLEVKSTN